MIRKDVAKRLSERFMVALGAVVFVNVMLSGPALRKATVIVLTHLIQILQ